MAKVSKATWAWRGPGKEFWSAIIDPTQPKFDLTRYMVPNVHFLKHCGKEIISAYRGESRYKVIFGKKGKGKRSKVGAYLTGIKKKKSPTGRSFQPLAKATIELRKEKKRLGVIPTARNKSLILRETDKHLLDGFGSRVEYKPTQIVVGWDKKEDNRIARIHQAGAKIPMMPDPKSRDVMMRVLGEVLVQAQAIWGTGGLRPSGIRALSIFEEKYKQLVSLKKAIAKRQRTVTFSKKVGGKWHKDRSFNLWSKPGWKLKFYGSNLTKAITYLGFKRVGYMSPLLQQFAKGQMSQAGVWAEMAKVSSGVFYDEAREQRDLLGEENWGAFLGKKEKGAGGALLMRQADRSSRQLLQIMDEFIATFVTDQDRLLKRFGMGVGINIETIAQKGALIDKVLESYGSQSLEDLLKYSNRAKLGQTLKDLQQTVKSAEYGYMEAKPGFKKTTIVIPQRIHYGFSKQLMKSLSAMGVAWLERGLK